MRFENSLATPALYDAIAGTPGTTGDTIAYQQNALNDTARPALPGAQLGRPAGLQPRLAVLAAARPDRPGPGQATTPLFLTQGFIENNTKPDGACDLFNGIAGPKRAWFGMWDHVRGNDTDGTGRLLMGRAGWFDEVMRWYDHYLKGDGPTPTPTRRSRSSPATAPGAARPSWPPADSTSYTARAAAGLLHRRRHNNGTAEGGSPNGAGIWTISPAFTQTCTSRASRA